MTIDCLSPPPFFPSLREPLSPLYVYVYARSTPDGPQVARAHYSTICACHERLRNAKMRFSSGENGLNRRSPRAPKLPFRDSTVVVLGLG